MPTPSERFNTYVNNNLYRRERRLFHNRGMTSRYIPFKRPDTRSIRTPGRDWVRDAVQPIFGYFAGGGWTFGRVDTARSRVFVDSFIEYEFASNGDVITLEYRVGNPAGEENAPDGWVRETRTIVVGTDIPEFSDLSPLDQFELR